MNYTPFYSSHIDNDGKIVDYGGWALPVNFGSQIKEHELVRSSAGMFDISNMVVTDIHGVDAREYLCYLISNDVSKLDRDVVIGASLYSALLNQEAGIIDDVTVYLMPFGYRLVTNSNTEAKVLNWIKQIARSYKVELFIRRELAILAVHGPEAILKVSQIHPHITDKLNQLTISSSFEDNGFFYARTQYTGEDGLEIMLPRESANLFWQLLFDVGVAPCGIGALDTLRLEAGVNLYGNEMDELVNPLECGMEDAVDLSDETRDFMGKKAFQLLKLSPYNQRKIGVLMHGNGILRNGQKVILNGQECGIITSGIYSPSLKQSIGIARINPNPVSKSVQVEIRGRLEPIELVTLPFIQAGKKCFKPLPR